MLSPNHYWSPGSKGAPPASAASPLPPRAPPAKAEGTPAPAPKGTSLKDRPGIANVPEFQYKGPRATALPFHPRGTVPPAAPVVASPAPEPSPLKFLKEAGPVGVFGSTPQRADSRMATLHKAGVSTAPTPPGTYSPVPAAAPAPAAAPSGSGKSVSVYHGGCMYMMPEGSDGIDEAAMMNPTVAHPGPRRVTFRSKFMPDGMNEHYQHMNRLTLAQVDPSDSRYKELPPQYTCMLPLDSASKARGTSGSSGYVTTVSKVISKKNGVAYALRRVDNVRSTTHIVSHVLKSWSRFAHPGVVPLRDAFLYQSSVMFLHDYFPGAVTLREQFLQAPGTPISEATLWSFAVQMCTAIEAVHRAGMSLRGVHASRVLLTSHNRLRIGGVGVIDVLEVESKATLLELQQQDVRGFVQLMLELATRNPSAASVAAKALDQVSSSYSEPFSRFMVTLASEPLPAYDITRILQPHVVHELEAVRVHADAVDTLLGREFENGRLLRLLVKMAFTDADSWSETSDTLLLKLFKDYVFRQVDGEGRVVVDMAHVLDSLNKLDVGDPTEVLLSSRDERTMLAASFADVRNCLNKTYLDLRSARRVAPTPSTASFGGGRGAPRSLAVAFGASAPGPYMGGAGGRGMAPPSGGLFVPGSMMGGYPSGMYNPGMM